MALWAVLGFLGSEPGSLDDLFLVLRASRDPLAVNDPAILGCSSLLDVVLKSLAIGAFGASVVGPIVTTLLLTVGVALWGGRLLDCGHGPAEDSPRGTPTPWAPLLGLGLASVLAEGSSYLLEAPLLALALLLCMKASRAHGTRMTPWAFAALSLARPEGVLIGVPWALARSGNGRWAALGGSLVGAGVWSLWLGARGTMPLPGGLLPLSFHVKHGSWWEEAAAGAAYAGTWLRTLEGSSTVLLIGAGLLSRGLSRRRALLATWALGLVVLAGGDGYMGARLLLPVMVLAIGSAAAARARVQLGGLVLLGLSGLGSVLSGGSMLLSSGFDGWKVDLEPELAIVSGLRGLQSEAGRPLQVVHRDQQVLLWLDPELAVRDASGLSDPEVAALPVEGAVRHGRDAFFLLSGSADVLLLDHQRLRAESWADRAFVPALTSEADRWIGKPRSRAEAQHWEQDWRLASIPHGRFACNVLLRAELIPAARRAGWLVADGRGE